MAELAIGTIGQDNWPGLIKLAEECAEVIQVCMKLIATNGEADHWDGTNLHTRLAEEMGDALGAMNFVKMMNTELDEEIFVDQASRKYSTFMKWQREPQANPYDCATGKHDWEYDARDNRRFCVACPAQEKF